VSHQVKRLCARSLHAPAADRALSQGVYIARIREMQGKANAFAQRCDKGRNRAPVHRITQL